MNNKKSFKRLLKILLVQITLLIGLSSIITAFANPIINTLGDETAEAIPEPVEIEENTEAIEQEELKDVKDEIMQGEQPSDEDQEASQEEQETQVEAPEETVQVQETTDTPEIAVQAATDASNFNFDASTGTITSLRQSVTLSNIIIPKQIGGVDVTTIGDDAFTGFTKITSISFEDGNKVTKIGNKAFKNMTSLSGIVLPSGVTSIGTSAFEKTGISNIVIPNGVTSIPDYCFRESTKLSDVTLGDKVTSIGKSAFYSTALTDIKLPNTLKTIRNRAFSATKFSSITIPDSVIDMGEGVFYSCRDLKSVKLSKKLTSISENMFMYCRSLISLEIPEGIYSIENGIFSQCDTLYEITIPSSVNTISSGAFRESSLKKIYIRSKTAGSISNAPWGSEKAAVIWKDTIIVRDSQGNDKYVYESSTKTLTKYLGSTSNDIIDIKKDFQDSGLNYEVEIIGESAFQGKTNISSVKIPDSVTQIKKQAFYYCSSATLESLPAQLTEIGQAAFLDCRKITSISIPDTVTIMGQSAFLGCSSLKSIEIGTGLSLLDNSVFSGCSSLEDITIPMNINIIGQNVFSNCKKLKFIRIPNYTKDQISGAPWGASNASVIWKGTLLVPDNNPKYVYEYDKNTKKGVITKYVGTDADVNIEQDFKSLGKPVTEIGDYAFANNTTLKKVVIPNTVTKIGNNSFYYSTFLENVTLSDNLTQIGSNSFHNCERLKNVILPKKLKFIGYRAFYSCKAIQSIEIPNSVTEIGPAAFEYCSLLETIKLPDYLTEISNGLFRYCSSLESVNFPSTLTIVEGEAFYCCSSLKKVELSDSITNIHQSAFLGCTKLSDVKLPANLKYIHRGAFCGCKQLTTINFPDKLNSIFDAAFAGTSLAGTITLPTSVVYVSNDAFKNVTTLDKLIIPYARAKCPYSAQHPYGLDENNPTQIVYGGRVPNIKAKVTPTKDSSGKNKYLLDFDIDFRDKNGNIYDAITRINLPDETGELSGNIIHVGQRESWSTADNNKTLDVTQRAVYKIQIAGLDNELHDYEILLGKIELENNEAEFYSGDMKTLTMNQILYRLGIIDKDGHTLIKDEFGVSVDCTYKISDEQMNAIHNMQYGDKLETKIGIYDPLLQKDYDITINVVSNAIRGKVVWDDNDNRKGLRPSSVNVNLYSKKANSSDAEKLVTTKAVTEDTDGNWSFGFEEASPWENKNVGGVVGTFHCGDELKYTISPTIPAYYSMEIKENPSNFFTITLTVDQIPVTGLVEGSNGIVLIGLSIGLLILSSAYFVIKKHRKIIKK